MTHLESELPVRRYDTPKQTVTIDGDRVTTTVHGRFGLDDQVTVTSLTDYVAIGHRLDSRMKFGSRYPDTYRQIMLVHKDGQSANILLAEERVPISQDHLPTEVRAQMEKCAKELALPIIDSDHPPQTERPPMGASPEQIHEMRLHDEIDLSVRDLVARGRLSISREIPPVPHGIVITRRDAGLQLDVGYSALGESLRMYAFLLALSLIFLIGSWTNYGPLWAFGIASGVITVVVFFVIFPMLYFNNGNQLTLSEESWSYRPASKILLVMGAQALNQLKVSEIEGIRRKGRDVLVFSDREIGRIRCRDGAMAEWLEQALLVAAAHGLSALEKR